jgi:hypothetical protein
MTRLGLIISAVLVATVGAASLSKLCAQSRSTTAALSGTVTDPAGAVVPKATVKIVGPENGITREFVTDASGQFSFALLPPATYNLTISAKGFNTVKQEAITLAVGDSVADNVKLQIATASEQVTVESIAPLLQTENANISTELASKQIQELPLNLRNVLSFATLDSAVNVQGDRQLLAAGGSEDTADQDYSFLNFGGGYFGTNLFLLNGGYDTSQDWGGVLYVPAPEDTEQVKVTSYSFSAEYGFSTGNAINITTKAGTHDWHFVADEFIRNQNLDANLYFNNLAGTPRPDDHRNQFGIAGGGPLYIPGLYRQRDKTFFFANYEGLRLNGGLSYSAQMPTQAQLGGDFSSSLTTTTLGTDCLGRPIYQGQIYNPYSVSTCANGSIVRDPYPGNIIPTTGVGAIDALAKKFATGNYWPAPKNPGGGFNFNTTVSAPTTSNEWGIRIDHNINANNRIYGQFSNKHEGKVQTGAFYGASNVAGPYVFDPNNRMFGVLGYSHVFSPTFVLSSTLFFIRNPGGNVVQGYPFKPSSLGLPGQLDSWTPQFPQVEFGNTFSGSGFYAPLGATQNSGQATFPKTNESLSIDASKILKTQSISIGYMGVRQNDDGGRLIPTVFNFSNQMTAGPDPSNLKGDSTGDALASFMVGAGNPGAGSAGSTGFAAFPAPTYYMHGMYVQDDWKAKRNLTLNLGFRYDLQMPTTARHDEQAYFDLHALNPISATTGIPSYGQIVYNQPGDRGLWKLNLHDFAPRVGFSYAVMPKLVLRGGYGIYYARNFYGGNGPNPGYSTSGVWTSSADGVHVTTPLAQAFQTGLVPVTGNALRGLTQVGQSPSVVDRNRPEPMTQQFSFGFQYAFSPNDVLDVNFVGSRGRHITLGGMNYGQLDPKYLAMGSALNSSMPTNPYATALSSLGLTAPSCPYTMAQSLMPYPEYCGSVSAQGEPVGINNYNALQANFKHRFGAGLIFTASYTFSKFLSDTGGPEEWGAINGDQGGSAIRNYYDLKADWSVDGNDIPHSLVLNYVYDLPVGRGKRFGTGMNRAEDAIVGGWEVSGITTAESGFPMSIGAGGNSASVFGGGQHADLTGQPLKSGHCGGTNGVPDIPVGSKYCFFNPTAFAAPADFTFGNAPRYFSNLRAPKYVDEDLTFAKWFSLKERLRFQIGVQMFNAFNHPNFGIPNAGVGSPNMGLSSSTQGARQMQGVLKLTY